MSIKRIETTLGPRWEVRYRIGGRNSKRVKRAFETRRDAESHYDDWLKRKREQRLSGSGIRDFEETTFEQEATHWLLVQAKTFSPGHLRRVERILKELIPRYGRLSPLKFHPGFLSNIQMEQLSKGPFKLSHSTVNRKLEVIRAVLNLSAKQRRIPYSPTLGYTKLREVREDVSFWERKDAENFLAFANEKYPAGTAKRWIYVVYLLALNSGLRAGEIWGLKYGDIKQDGEVLHIQRQYDRVHRDFRTTKGKSSRLVPCNADLLQELLALRPKVNPPETIFFDSENGNPVDHDNFRNRIFQVDREEWGGRKIRFHDLRHTAATLMISENLDLRTVQEICGHKDVKTTMNYAHLLGEKIKHAARTFSIKPTQAASPTKPVLRLIKNG